MKRFALSTLFFIALFAVWHLVVLAKVWSVVLLPDPISVWEYLKGAAGDGTLLQASIVTMRRLLAGYMIGIAAGLPLGLLTARFKLCEDTLGVLALGLQTLPSVCWVPLAILWFRQTEAAMLFVVIMGTLWSVIIATDNVFATCRLPSPARRGRWVQSGCTPGSTLTCRRLCSLL